MKIKFTKSNKTTFMKIKTGRKHIFVEAFGAKTLTIIGPNQRRKVQVT